MIPDRYEMVEPARGNHAKVFTQNAHFFAEFFAQDR